jgi:hypothetical protein
MSSSTSFGSSNCFAEINRQPEQTFTRLLPRNREFRDEVGLGLTGGGLLVVRSHRRAGIKQLISHRACGGASRVEQVE